MNELIQKKRGQMKMSFGMIFSIVLIIIFIAFAFYAIQKFLEFQDTVKVEQFIENLQNDVDSAWKSSKVSQEKSYSLPRKVGQVCFRNEEKNLVMTGDSFGRTDNIEHLNIVEIASERSLCFLSEDGKISLILKKDFGENLVTIEKVGN